MRTHHKVAKVLWNDGKGMLLCTMCEREICDGLNHADKEYYCANCRASRGQQSLTIALDHDGTYTAAPELWQSFVKAAKEQGHRIEFVTFRMEHWDNEDIEENARILGIPINYTNMKQKKHCFQADIWIDDSPEVCASFEDMEAMINGCRDKGDTHATF